MRRVLALAAIFGIVAFAWGMTQQSCSSEGGGTFVCTPYVGGSVLVAAGAFLFAAGTAAAVRDLMGAYRTGTSVPLRTYVFTIPLLLATISLAVFGSAYAILFRVFGRP